MLLLKEIDANGLLVLVREVASAESLEHGGLPDAAIPDDDDLNRCCNTCLVRRGWRR
jgi:hypothetical protein